MVRQALVILMVVVAFGILVPWYKGLAFLQPWTIVAYACLALLFVAPAAAEFWAVNPRPASPGAILGRIAAVVSFGWGIAFVILATAIVTLNVSNSSGKFVIPQQQLCLAALLFSLTASIAVAVSGALLARRLSATGVKNIIRFAFLLLLLGLAFGTRFLPERLQILLSDYSTRRAITSLAWKGSAICAIGAALLLIPLLRKSPEPT